jgi:magnesium-transporting ATPase (P-type)
MKNNELTLRSSFVKVIFLTIFCVVSFWLSVTFGYSFFLFGFEDLSLVVLFFVSLFFFILSLYSFYKVVGKENGRFGKYHYFFIVIIVVVAISSIRFKTNTRSLSKEEQVFSAAVNGDSSKLYKLRRKDGMTYNLKDEKGNTPLHYAVLSKDQQTVFQILFDETVKKDEKNDNGENPMDVAVKNKLWLQAYTLAKHGAAFCHYRQVFFGIKKSNEEVFRLFKSLLKESCD